MKTTLLVLGMLTAGLAPLTATAGNVPYSAVAEIREVAGPGSISEALAAQKTLGQRIVQAYARIGLGVAPDEAREQLDAAMQGFERNLSYLEIATDLTGVDRIAARQSIWMLAGQWEQIQSAAAEPSTIHSALRLAGAMDGALATLDRVGMELASTPRGTSFGELLERQAELSQRLARAYWLRGLGDGSAAARRDLDGARTALEANLNMLRAHPDSEHHVSSAIERLHTEAAWLLAAIDNDGARSYPLIVAEAAEQVMASAAALVAAEAAGAVRLQAL